MGLTSFMLAISASLVGCPNPPIQEYFCTYNGRVYRQGQSWMDGCDYNCTCVDVRLNTHRCRHLCPNYGNLPSECYLRKEPGECCAKSSCPTVSAKDGCVYKKKTYTQNEKWAAFNVCRFFCQCIDSAAGEYECTEEKCDNPVLSFHVLHNKMDCVKITAEYECMEFVKLPDDCRLVPDPTNPCCKAPDCYTII